MTELRRIRLDQILQLEDGDYRIVEFARGFFKLRNELTTEYRLIEHAELSRLLPPGEPTPAIDAVDELPIATLLDELDDDSRFLIPHLQELVDGRPAIGTEPRPEYDSSLSMTARRGSKLLELHRLGHHISESTLKRKLALYKDRGPAGIVDRRSLRSETPLGRADERVLEELSEIMSEATNMSTCTLAKIRRDLKKRLITKHPGEDIAMPSTSSVRRYVNMLDHGRKTTGSAIQRRTIANSPKQQYTARLAILPGHEAQIDSTQLDVLVLGPDGRPIRPTLTVMIDKATRSVIGYSLLPSNANGFEHAILLARCLTPASLRPGPDYHAEHELPEMPWSRYLTPEKRREYDTHRPYIVPQRIITDNGKDFVSDVFRSACNRYGIDLTEAKPGEPTNKQLVERFFSTVKSMFAENLPGFTGGRTEFRGADPASDDLLDLETVDELLDRWISVVWQNRTHDTLRDPRNPSVKHTPNAMYAAMFDLTGYVPVHVEPEDYVALMPRELRVIHPDGIEFRGRMYDSPHLRPYRGRTNEDGRALRTDVFYDPTNPRQVWVCPDRDGNWIICEWTEARGLSRPNHRSILNAAHRYTLEHGGFTKDEVDDITDDLIEDARSEQAARRMARMKEAIETPRATPPNEPVCDPAADEDDPFDDFEPLRAL